MGVLIRVLVTACTSGELLLAQMQALERHMIASYELHVVNDAKQDEHFSNNWERGKVDEISAACQEWTGAIEHRFPQEWHTDRRNVFPDEPDEFADVENANTRCADAVQYGVNLLLAESDDPILILDADMVPYRAVNPTLWLREESVWGVPQFRDGIIYLWNGLILVDPRRARSMDLFNLDCAHVNDTPLDVGGMLYLFLKANQNAFGAFGICSAAEHVRSPNGALPECLQDFFVWDCDAQYDHYRISETYGQTFAHLGGGGNWEVRDKDIADERLRRFIEAVS